MHREPLELVADSTYLGSQAQMRDRVQSRLLLYYAPMQRSDQRQTIPRAMQKANVLPYVRGPESVNSNPLSSELSGPNEGQMAGSERYLVELEV